MTWKGVFISISANQSRVSQKDTAQGLKTEYIILEVKHHERAARQLKIPTE